ncbi:hypothetical protein GN956_G23754 [Arapaima gigas]
MTEDLESRVCMVSLTEKEILAKTVHHSEVTEVLLSCDVELEKDHEESSCFSANLIQQVRPTHSRFLDRFSKLPPISDKISFTLLIFTHTSKRPHMVCPSPES